MAACLHSLLLEYCDMILLRSEDGMFTYTIKSSNLSSSMLRSTVERLCEVRLSSGNTTGERDGDTHYTTIHYILYITGMPFCLLLCIPLNKQVHVQWFTSIFQSQMCKAIHVCMYFPLNIRIQNECVSTYIHSIM